MPDLLYDYYNKNTSLTEKGHSTPRDDMILIPGFSQMAKLLTLLSAKGTAWRWRCPVISAAAYKCLPTHQQTNSIAGTIL